jgi:competence protein ComGC
MAKKSINEGKEEISQNQASSFRGLTIFELMVILFVISFSLFWGFSAKSKAQKDVNDQLRKSRVSLLKEHFSVYTLENDSLPSQESYDNEETRGLITASLLADEGQDAISDPQDKEKVVTYLAEPEGCAPKTDNPCTKGTFSLTLADGEEFYRFAIKPGSEDKYLQESAQDGENGVLSEEVLNQ